MKLECVKERLSQQLSKIDKIPAKNANLPILSCILLSAHKGELVLRATNLDVGVEISLPAHVEKEGSVAIPAQMFSSFISQLKGDKTIHLEAVDGNVKVSCGGVVSVIKGLAPDDFPVIPEIDSVNTTTINPESFVKGILSVSFAASQSQVKPELASTYIYSVDDSLIFVSTDSFRLAEKKVKVKNAPDFNPVIIPAKNIADIARSLTGVDEDIKVSFDKNQIQFRSSALVFVSRVIEATFPNYAQIIPKEHSTEAVVLKSEFIEALKTSSIFSDKFNQIKVLVKPSEKTFEAQVKNGDVGEIISKIHASLSGESVELSFNQRYITDAMSSIGSDSLTLSFVGQNKPLVIRGVGDRSFLYLVMPMNK